jgi:ribonuclease I
MDLQDQFSIHGFRYHGLLPSRENAKRSRQFRSVGAPITMLKSETIDISSYENISP